MGSAVPAKPSQPIVIFVFYPHPGVWVLTRDTISLKTLPECEAQTPVC